MPIHDDGDPLSDHFNEAKRHHVQAFGKDSPFYGQVSIAEKSKEPAVRKPGWVASVLVWMLPKLR